MNTTQDYTQPDLRKHTSPRPTKAPASPLLTLDQLLSLPPPEWLVEDVLPAGGMTVMYGASGSYKTFLALDVALSVAAELPWQGHDTRRGAVLYIAGEGTSGLSPRAQAWIKSHSASPAEFLIWPRPVDIATHTKRDGVVSALCKVDVAPRLIVVDTLARCFGDGDENSAKDMNKFVAGLDDLRARFPGAAVLVVHHTGKDKGKEARGSSALFAAADTVIRVSRDDRLPLVEVTCMKQKDAAEFPTLLLTPVEVPLHGRPGSLVLREPGPDLKNIRFTKGAAKLNANDTKALEALRKLGPAGAARAEWSAACGLKRQTFHDVLKRLLADGLVCEVDGRYFSAES